MSSRVKADHEKLIPKQSPHKGTARALHQAPTEELHQHQVSNKGEKHPNSFREASITLIKPDKSIPLETEEKLPRNRSQMRQRAEITAMGMQRELPT